MTTEPTYENLKEEVKKLKEQVRKLHFSIGAFLKHQNIAQAELIIGSKVAYKTDHTVLLPDFSSENLEYIISHHTQ